MTGSSVTRALRATVFAALAVPLSALGHVLVTGRPLPLDLVIAAGAVVFLLAVVLSGAERGFLQIAAIFLPVELLLNTTFNLGQDACPSPTRTHGLDLMVCGGGTVGNGGGTPLTLAPALVELLLLVVHVVATLLAALWLRLAEAALVRLPRLVGELARLTPGTLLALLRLALAPLSARPAPGVPLPEPRPEHAPTEDLPLGPSRRRGPPAAFALAC
ncbi:hypothetical protein P3T37_001705 [Kitasatospora sp. MAA4]|uniref:hypothetical protein n=1 Tax=Kitasatospora sp. MAA4 TaxID=3035093 RepID=UPI0024751E26|nr:hypothetical protein [Kitasatospora sp. MAA4]MDH6132320.1 hypothetical protein [Kitasatospora sp. MAA4]